MPFLLQFPQNLPDDPDIAASVSTLVLDKSIYIVPMEEHLPFSFSHDHDYNHL